jgi:hypothetical protein
MGQILQPQYTPRMATFWPGAANAPPATWTGNATGGATYAVYGGRGLTANVWPLMAAVPFDCHSLIALTAPRYMLDTESFWTGGAPCGSAQIAIAAQQAWTALGFSNRLWTRYTDVDTVSNGQHEMTQTHWTAMVQFCEYVYRDVPLPATSTTTGSQSIWCNASTPAATNVAGTTGNSRGYPTTSPIYGGKGADGNSGFGWSTPTLT